MQVSSVSPHRERKNLVDITVDGITLCFKQKPDGTVLSTGNKTFEPGVSRRSIPDQMFAVMRKAAREHFKQARA